MAKTLTVHNAEITTATVQVRTLTISGKQVTLAVFRQLVDEQPLDYPAGWLGRPWGTVNYHPDKVLVERAGGYGTRDMILNCVDVSAHRHVVWQKGDELRRGIVWHPRAAFYPELQDELATPEQWAETIALPQLFIAV